MSASFQATLPIGAGAFFQEASAAKVAPAATRCCGKWQTRVQWNGACRRPLGGDDGAVSGIERKPLAKLKPLSPRMSVEVRDWASELRAIWAAAGLSMNEFACLHPIDESTISRYLSGQRVPRDRWFLDALLAHTAMPVTPAVREHLTALQLRALEVADPHEHQVRLVKDELEITVTSGLEAERYARALEEELAERNRQVQLLADDKVRLQAAWDADRAAMQAEYERLTREIGEITRQLNLARQREALAIQRCQYLEGLLDGLDAEQVAQAPSRTRGGSLVVTRMPGQEIMIGDDISLRVTRVAGDKVRIGIESSGSRPVYRGELPRGGA